MTWEIVPTIDTNAIDMINAQLSQAPFVQSANLSSRVDRVTSTTLANWTGGAKTAFVGLQPTIHTIGQAFAVQVQQVSVAMSQFTNMYQSATSLAAEAYSNAALARANAHAFNDSVRQEWAARNVPSLYEVPVLEEQGLTDENIITDAVQFGKWFEASVDNALDPGGPPIQGVQASWRGLRDAAINQALTASDQAQSAQATYKQAKAYLTQALELLRAKLGPKSDFAALNEKIIQGATAMAATKPVNLGSMRVIVQPNDTPWGLATKYLGGGENWKQLYQYANFPGNGPSSRPSLPGEPGVPEIFANDQFTIPVSVLMGAGVLTGIRTVSTPAPKSPRKRSRNTTKGGSSSGTRVRTGVHGPE